MSTLDAVQRLSDGQFHRLGDDLLRRIDPRYRRLRTHGLNERGESIVGQPDSYVGETANACTVAVCYTVQRAGWWNKVVSDVREAVAASPSVAEVVAVVPHNADRDGPRDKTIDWLADARAAAGMATFRLFDGREFARALDTDHQDLRYDHLAIPYSRLTAASLLVSARTATTSVLDAVRTSGRYDPARYAPRSADRELYRLWQKCLRPSWDGERRVAPARMIALVNDSGVGKTSLVCSFAHSLGTVLPVVLVQARDLAFGSEDALVAHAVHSLQGVLDPAARVGEEVAVARCLGGAVPLTLVVDGLDEAHDTAAVRKAVTYWLRSRLGQNSILVVTSRPEFWKLCSDQFWSRWLPGSVVDDRSPVQVVDRPEADRSIPDSGVRLPDRYSEEELEASWVQAGQHRAELYTLGAEARAELRHPFTLRVYLDLCAGEAGPPPVVSRSDLMERWLNRRLDAEAVPAERITRHHLQRALCVVAKGIADTGGGAMSVDELVNVPRFDPARPPGPVVQRLIGANVLESVPGRADLIRFAVEAVQDFYRAEADVEDIRANPVRVAERLSDLRFTDAYPRLVRIGRRLADDEARHPFVDRLAEIAPPMAGVVLGIAPTSYAPGVRAKVAQALGASVTARHRIRAAFALTMLGQLNCPEAVEVLMRRLFAPADPHPHLKAVGATALAKLGSPQTAEYVYRWEWYGVWSGNETHYSREKLSLLRQAKPEFRQALADYAVSQLTPPSGTREHAKAVCVLGYLGDDRLVHHFRERAGENGYLRQYENHALVALGTDAAGELFSQSVRYVGRRLGAIPHDHAHNDARNELIGLVHFLTSDVRYLMTRPFEGHLLRLIEDDDQEVSLIACDLAKRAFVTALLYPTVAAAARRKGWIEFEQNQDRSAVTGDLWVGWWQAAPDVPVRQKLLAVLPLYPTAVVEEVLLDCLDAHDLRRPAARGLGKYGAVRSAPQLRQMLAEGGGNDALWDRMAAADALGDIRRAYADPNTTGTPCRTN